MLYFDNSATTSFKPECVLNAATNAARYLSANPGRSGHSLSVKASMLVYRTRERLAAELNCQPQGIIFTHNCTDALNLALLGTAKKGGHVITTVYEHNSVLRCLEALRKRGEITYTAIAPGNNGAVTAENIDAAVRDNTYLVAVNHISNVTGAMAPIEQIGRLCKKRGLLFSVDGAQSGGYYKIDMKESGISLLSLAPHKGFHSIGGVGVLAVAEGVKLKAIRYGGTGTMSMSLDQPDDMPEGFEAGTLPLSSVAALCRAVDYGAKNRLELTEKIVSLGELFLEGIISEPRIKIYTPSCAPGGIAAFNIGTYSSEQVADILSNQYDIAVRAGLHCAPLVHRYLGTTRQGIVRASFGCDNTFAEVEAFIRAVKEIAN